MKKANHMMRFLLLTVLAAAVLCVPALALTESEVEAQVAASGKETITGNVLIWFLCAVAFLKVSQKIDSFMSVLGVNVGRTGGSMLSDAMLTFRAITMVAGGVGHPLGGGQRGSGSSAGGAGPSGKSGAAAAAGFFQGGLVGMVSRKVTNDAVKTATSRTAAIHTAQNAQKTKAAGAVHSFSERKSSTASQKDSAIHSGGFAHTEGISRTDTQVRTDGAAPQEGVIRTESDPSPAVPIHADTHPRAEVPVPDGGQPFQPNSQQESAAFTDREVSSSTVSQREGQRDSVQRQEGVIQTDSTPVVPGSSEFSRPDTVPPDTGRSDAVHTDMSHSDTVRTDTARTDAVRQDSSSERYIAGGHSWTKEKVEKSSHATAEPVRGLGGKIFSQSLQSGSPFANDVIGMVARGDMRSTGSITGDLAAQSLQSYMGHTALGEHASEKVVYSEVEIGGGRITGREITPEHPQGIEFAMYHVDQYAKPEGDFQKVFSADGAQWYKQHAVDTVVKKPFKAPDGEIDYQKEIVKRLPTPPKRKDRM